MLLSDAVATVRRLAVVGLAKNTGKTVALTTVLRELEAAGHVVGVTSIGNDGETHDAIDARIDKPAIRLAAGSLVATTDLLLRRSRRGGGGAASHPLPHAARPGRRSGACARPERSRWRGRWPPRTSARSRRS